MTAPPEATQLKCVRLQTVGFILWPRTDRLFHSDLAEGCARSPDLSRVPRLVISAGFASLHEGEVRCWGRSESLNVDSLPEDAALLAMQLGLERP